MTTTDDANALFDFYKKQLQDYLDQYWRDLLVEPDQKTPSDFNNANYAGDHAKSIHGKLATVLDEMKARENERTTGGLWQGPAADVFGSAMKSLIGYVQGFVTALQPGGDDTGWAAWLHNIADHHYYDITLNYLAYADMPTKYVDNVLKNMTVGKWTLLSAAAKMDESFIVGDGG